MTPTTTVKTAERLQKIIAQVGLTSRRDAETWIEDGLVTVNGKTSKLGDKATLGVDSIKVKGKLIQTPAHKVYYIFHKPKNVIAMVNEDAEGRQTIKDWIKKSITERVFPVGRMDFKGEGLVLLTNDGELAQDIQNSKTVMRRYQIKLHRSPTPEEMIRLAKPARIEGKLMTPHHLRIVNTYTKNALLEISFQGMGAIDIKAFFENKGFIPEKVARVGLGHLSIEKLPAGQLKKIEESSVRALVAQPELALRQIAELVSKKTKQIKKLDPLKAKAQKAEDREFAKTRRAGEASKQAPRFNSRSDKRSEKRTEKRPEARSVRFKKTKPV
jgi:23S rRNA pseudouridine2605 synthase